MELTLKALESYLSDLQNVPQNPVYHGEGDVLTHTHRVLDALRSLPAFQRLNAAEQNGMLLAAALHDMGKKTCTRWEEGRWTFPHHGAVGAGMTRELLTTQFDLGGTEASLCLREMICTLIQWHMRPVHCLENADPARFVRKMAAAGEVIPAFTLEKLGMLSQADMLGRICADQKEQLENIALFQELAQEQRCFCGPYPYQDTYSRYTDLSGGSLPPDQRAYSSQWGTVILMSGLPGTGKDTYIAQYLADLPMLSLDQLRQKMGLKPGDNEGAMLQAAREQAKAYLRQHQAFVLNATNLSPMAREKWISLIHQYHAAVRILYLETGWREREKRNLARANPVPEKAVMRMLRHWSPPLPHEAEEVIWRCT